MIDFEYTVDTKRIKYGEFGHILNQPELIMSLGGDYSKNRYHWDDAFSVKKIFEELNFVGNKEFSNTLLEIKKMIGNNEVISVYNNFFLRKITLLKNYLRPIKYRFKVLYFIYALIVKLFHLLTFKKKKFSTNDK